MRFVTNSLNMVKPYVENQMSLHFNMSHSGDYVIFAFSYGPVGIDIEKKENIRDLQSIANRFFSKAESLYLHNSQGTRKVDMFYKFWTHKEAWLKYQGVGLHGSLNLCEIDPLEETQHIHLPGTLNCQLDTLPAPDGYAASIGFSPTIKKKLFFSLSDPKRKIIL